MEELTARLRALPKVELHQHVDGSIPAEVTWSLMRHYRLHPVESLEEMRRHLELQDEEEGELLAYLDKMHYPLWVTQFYENIAEVAYRIAREAFEENVRIFELRYSPIIHTYAGMTVRQAFVSVLEGLNRAEKEYPDLRCGLIIIAMRQAAS